jgi:hypothetical protein
VKILGVKAWFCLIDTEECLIMWIPYERFPGQLVKGLQDQNGRDLVVPVNGQMPFES